MGVRLIRRMPGVKRMDATTVVWLSLECTHERLVALLQWMLEERIHSPIDAGSTGAGRLERALYPDDADRVLEWLQAAEET